MKIRNESDIPEMINQLTKSCPNNVTIIPNPPYKAYMTEEGKQKIRSQLSFILPAIAGYGVTWIWIMVTNYYKQTLTQNTLLDGSVTSFFPAIMAFLLKIRDWKK